MEFFSDADGYSFLYNVNLAVTLASSLVLIVLYRTRPHSFVKPSLLIAACYHLLAQWPLVLLTGFSERYITDPWAASILVNGFVLAGLLMGIFCWNEPARSIWSRLPAAPWSETDVGTKSMVMLGGMAMGLALIYLAFVPFRETGLYVLIADPASAVQAREDSLKLVESALPKYALTFLSSAIAPVLTALVVLFAMQTQVPVARKLQWVALLGAVWFMAILSGAKGVLMFLLFAGFAAFGWQSRLKISWTWLASGILIILLPAFVVTMLFATEDQGAESALTVDSAFVQFGEVLKRAFVAPTAVGIWYVDYAQQNGPIGIAGISKLAELAGIVPIDLANKIGLTYGPEYYGHEVVESISASTGFLFAFYGYFGKWALLLSALCLALCDFLLIPIRRFPDAWLVPALSVVSLGALKFTQADFQTVWITHGLGLGLLVIWLISGYAKPGVKPNSNATMEAGT